VWLAWHMPFCIKFAGLFAVFLHGSRNSLLRVVADTQWPMTLIGEHDTDDDV